MLTLTLTLTPRRAPFARPATSECSSRAHHSRGDHDDPHGAGRAERSPVGCRGSPPRQVTRDTSQLLLKLKAGKADRRRCPEPGGGDVQPR